VQSHGNLKRITKDYDEARLRLILKNVLNCNGRGQIPNGGFADGGVRDFGIPEQFFIISKIRDSKVIVAVKESKYPPAKPGL
jgi:hypothetical protein